MTQLTVHDGTSPFDRIKQTRPDGSEFWSARKLQSLMAYARWENLQPALARAMQAASNTGMDVAGNFLRSQEVSGRRGPAREDYELTREAAYLLAMNGDPAKPEVAAAQAYFAARTVQAETIETRMPAVAESLANPATLSRLDILRMALESEEQRLQIEARNRELEPKADAYDTYMTAEGGHLVREVAKTLRQEWPGLRVHELFNFLVAERLLFRRSAPICGQNMYDAKSEHVPRHFLVTATTVQHSDGRLCAHTTVNVTPAGVELIRRRIRSRTVA